MTNPISHLYKENKLIFFILLSVLFATVIFYSYSWYNGINQVVSWQILSELGNTNAIIDRFQIANQAYEIPAKVYYVTEQYVASTMQINELASNIWLILFFLGLSFVAASVTTFSTYWYYGAMAVLIIVLASFSIDVVFGSTNYLYSGLLLGLFIGLSYYFFAFKPNLALLSKTLFFVLFFGAFGFLISFFAKDTKPFLYLAAQSIPSALILFTVFVFAMSYEIILAILAISTKGGGSNSFLNFTIGSVIYLLNISLTYLHNINYLNWDILYFSPYLLLLISITLGFWSLGKKDVTFQGIISLSGAFLLYFGLSIMALALVAFAFSTGNDPLLEATEDAIIYAHLVMGVLFYAYVFFNFFRLFKQHLDVSKIIFKPLQFPLIYFRAGAALVIFAILVNNDFFPALQGFAGFYNAKADYSVANKEYKLAEAYYKTALAYEHQNHKSNYALASLAAIQGDNPTSGSYFRMAIQKKPTEYAFAALSNSLQKEDLFFEAMFAIRDGLKVFPKSGELQNNLALLFEKSKLMDSSLVYLEKAKINAEKSEIPEANIQAFWIKTHNNNDRYVYLGDFLGEKMYNSLSSNILAANLISNDLSATYPTKYLFDSDTTLSMANFAWLNNQTLLNTKSKKHTDFPFQKLLQNEANFNIAKDIQTAYIFNEYYAGDKLKALDIMQSNLYIDSSASSKYNQILFNTLLKKATDENVADPKEITDQKSALALLDRNPLSIPIIKKATEVLNKEGNTKEAYEALIAAKKYLPESAELQKLYILQCFKIHMNQYAKDGLQALKELNISEYNSFLPVYQAQMSLVEKQAEGFN